MGESSAPRRADLVQTPLQDRQRRRNEQVRGQLLIKILPTCKLSPLSFRQQAAPPACNVVTVQGAPCFNARGTYRYTRMENSPQGAEGPHLKTACLPALRVPFVSTLENA